MIKPTTIYLILLESLRNMKIKSLLCITLVSLFILNGCSAIEQIANYNLERLYEEKEVNTKEIITLPESEYIKDTIELSMENPDSLNPLDGVSYSVDQALKLIYEPIFYVEEDYSLVNGCIESYEKISERVFRFYIGESLFHNGLALVSDDILFSFEYIGDHQESGYRYALDYIDTITIRDDKTFDVKFKSINYYNLYSLTFPIISNAYVAGDTYDNMVPVGTGDYAYYDFQEMLYLKLRRSDHSISDASSDYININIVRLPEDEYSMFLSKRIDLYAPAKTEWTMFSDDRNIGQYTYDSPYYYFIGFNHQHRYLKDLSYRQLMAASVPYDTIKEVCFLGHLSSVVLPIPSNHVFVSGMDEYYGNNDDSSYYITQYEAVDKIDFLKTLRSQYIYFDYQKPLFTIIYNEADWYQSQIANVLRDNMEDDYIRFNIQGLDPDSYLERLETKDFDMYIGSIRTGILPNLGQVFDSEGHLNYGGFDSPNINGLINTYYKVLLDDQYYRQLENITRIVSDELPIIPLGYLENGFFVHNQVNGAPSSTFFNQYYDFRSFTPIR